MLAGSYICHGIQLPGKLVLSKTQGSKRFTKIDLQKKISNCMNRLRPIVNLESSSAPYKLFNYPKTGQIIITLHLVGWNPNCKRVLVDELLISSRCYQYNAPFYDYLEIFQTLHFLKTF